MSSTFGRLLRQYRTAAGFSQEHLAGLARISVESVSALERGTRRAPYRDTVALLAEALQLDATGRSDLEAAAERGRARSPRTGEHAKRPSAEYRPLPLQTTSFVGREPELANIAALLDDNRLVTVTGSGGVGKTRTVIEVAARLPSSRRETLRFVDLSPLSDARFIVGAIEPGLGVSFTDSGSTADELVAALRSMHALIVLDNCEHLISDVALVVSGVLRSCPNVSFLTTSRERLAVSGEVVYRLPSLEIPDRTPGSIARARQYAALDLFMQRATMINRSFEFGDADVDSVVDACRKLDGIPLAIELAAARAATLGLAALSARLNQGLAVNGSPRNLPARQQTMLATIAWSYDLLDDLEKLALQRVSVFVGGFTLAAAEAVCADEDIESSAIADLLSSLVDKSLINVALSGGRARYSILDSVKSFAHGQLAAKGQAETLSRRHAEWLAVFADWIEVTRTGKPEPWLRAETAPELENVRAALAWAFQTGSRENMLLAARIVGGLRTIWLTSGRQGECAHWAEVALAHIEQGEHLDIVARLMRALVQSTDGFKLFEWGRRAIHVFELVGDRVSTALLHSQLANAYRRRGRFEEAERQMTLASGLFADLPRSMPYALFLQNRAQNHLIGARYEEALADVGEGRAIVTSLGDVDAYTWELIRAEVRFEMGDTVEAIATAQIVLEGALSEEVSHEREVIGAYVLLALFWLVTGDLALGTAAAREALLRTRWRHGADALLGGAMITAALATALRGEVRFAANVIGASQALTGEMREFHPKAQRLLRQILLQHLAPEEVESLQAEGAAQPLDAIITETLRLLE